MTDNLAIPMSNTNRFQTSRQWTSDAFLGTGPGPDGLEELKETEGPSTGGPGQWKIQEPEYKRLF